MRFWSYSCAGAAVLLLLMAPPVHAQEPLTIEQLVAIALERAPALRAARSGIAAAEAQATQAGLRANPMLMPRHQEQLGGADRQSMVDVEWPLELGRRDARVAAARREAEVTTVTVSDRERVLAAAIREQAGRLLAARRMLTVVDEALTSARGMRDLLERRASEGAIPQLEANLTALEMWRIEAEQAFAAADAEAAAIELRAMAGLPPDAPLVLSESLETVVRDAPPVTASAEDAAALEARTDVREAAARVALADARIAAARQEGGLDASVVGGYSRMRFGFPQRGFDATGMAVPIQGVFHNVTIGTTLTLPLWNRNQGAVAAAEAERTGAEEILAARRLAARAELDAAVVRDREARRAVELYAASIRALAQRDADVILEAYELGGIRLTELLDHQRRYLEIERAYTDTLSRAYDARVAVRRARGEIR